jgi:hypothetical protein
VDSGAPSRSPSPLGWLSIQGTTGANPLLWGNCEASRLAGATQQKLAKVKASPALQEGGCDGDTGRADHVQRRTQPGQGGQVASPAFKGTGHRHHKHHRGHRRREGRGHAPKSTGGLLKEGKMEHQHQIQTVTLFVKPTSLLSMDGGKNWVEAPDFIAFLDKNGAQLSFSLTVWRCETCGAVMVDGERWVREIPELPDAPLPWGSRPIGAY